MIQGNYKVALRCNPLPQFGARDLHRWRLTLGFMKAPNGNVAFNLFISLRDQPEIRFQYDQQTVQ